MDAEHKDAERKLVEAQKAWRDWRASARQISRLRGYRGMTPAMKADYKEQCDKHHNAEQMLVSILESAQ